MMRPGQLIGVGVGPGDPELLTLKAARAIERAPVIAFISARGHASRARHIAAAHIKPGTRELAFAMPMSGDLEDSGPIYDVMATAIGAELTQGRDVAFLCEGDPLLYGSFIHLVGRMGDRFSCSAIPGIAAMSAAAAATLRPLASREAPLLVIPATLPETRLEQLAGAAGALAFLKVGRHVAKVRAVLRARGLLDGAVLVENVGLADQRIRALAGVREDVVGYFSLVLARRPDGPA
jgi:precorrin-2/cobalt-factor-2 C20-methyltransferase